MRLPLPRALFREFSADSSAAPALWRLRKNSSLSPTSFISQNLTEHQLLSRALGDVGKRKMDETRSGQASIRHTA